jgi:hypothetical protein
LAFNASMKCPVYQVPAEIADAVSAKQAQDDAKVAELVAKGTPVAQRRPDIDGGMNRIFAAKLPDGATGLSDPEPSGVQTAAYSRAPGTIPPHVNPPKANVAASTSYSSSLFATSEEPVAAVPSTRVASASSEGGFFSSLAKKVGIGGSETTATTTVAPAAAVPTPAARPKAVASKAGPSTAPAASAPVAAKPAPAPVVAATRPPLKPTLSAEPSAPASGGGAGIALSGAAPVVSANSFSDRFSATR